MTQFPFVAMVPHALRCVVAWLALNHNLAPVTSQSGSNGAQTANLCECLPVSYMTLGGCNSRPYFGCQFHTPDSPTCQDFLADIGESFCIVDFDCPSDSAVVVGDTKYDVCVPDPECEYKDVCGVCGGDGTSCTASGSGGDDAGFSSYCSTIHEVDICWTEGCAWDDDDAICRPDGTPTHGGGDGTNVCDRIDCGSGAECSDVLAPGNGYTCTCGTGYDGVTTVNEAATCVDITVPPVEDWWKVSTSITFNANIEDIPEGSLKRAEFEQNFKQTVASALGDGRTIMEDMVIVEKILAASIIVEWHLLVPPNIVIAATSLVQTLKDSNGSIEIVVDGITMSARVSTMATPTSSPPGMEPSTSTPTSHSGARHTA